MDSCHTAFEYLQFPVRSSPKCITRSIIQCGASRLAMYEILRKVRNVFNKKIRGGVIHIEEFYQPANVITDTALDWIDNERPEGAPFFLVITAHENGLLNNRFLTFSSVLFHNLISLR